MQMVVDEYYDFVYFSGNGLPHDQKAEIPDTARRRQGGAGIGRYVLAFAAHARR